MRKVKGAGRFFVFLILLSGAGFASLTQPARSAEVNRAVMATGAFMGGYYLLGGAICAEVNQAGADMRCAIETSKGQVENLQALRAGRVNVALAQSDWLHHAHAGDAAPFSGDKAFKDLRAMISLSGAPLVLLARSQGDVKEMKDLPGKRIDIGKSGSPRRAIMNDVLSAMEWDLGKFRLASELPEAEAVKALCAGQIDILALAGFIPDKEVRLALKTCSLKIVPAGGSARDKILKMKPYYSAITIPAGSYTGLKEDIPSLGTRVVLMATPRLAEKDAYSLVRTITEHLPEIRKLHPSLGSIERSSLASGGISAPLHAGAARFFKEAKLR